MKILHLAGFILLVCAVYAKPASNSDHDRKFDEEDPDMQNDDYDDYGPIDEDLDDKPPETGEMPDIPVVVSHSQDFLVHEHQTVTLPCEITHAETYVTMWKKNGEVVYQDSIRFAGFGNYQLLPNKTLIITNVGANETAEYTCLIPLNSKDIPDPFITHHVRVQTSPKIQSLKAADDIVQLEEGRTLVLTCKAEGDPEPKIKWSFNGKRIEEEGVTMTIQNIGHHDAGIYQCLADNNIGKPAHSGIHISIVHKPVVRIEKLSVNSAENYNAELKCLVNAVPAASVNWKRNGINIAPDDRKHITHENHTYTLHIESVQTADFGEYTCSATNRIGRTEKDISLTGTPVPIFEKSYGDDNKKGTVLVWMVESNSPITEYILHYKNVKDSDWSEVKPEVVNTNGTLYNVKHSIDTSMYGKYEAKIKARNSYGWSKFSNIVEFNSNDPAHVMEHRHLHSEPNHQHTVEAEPEIIAQENLQKSNNKAGGSGTILPTITLICLTVFAALYNN